MGSLTYNAYWNAANKLIFDFPRTGKKEKKEILLCLCSFARKTIHDFVYVCDYDYALCCSIQ